MAKMMETVLYYNPGKPDTMKHVAMMKSVLVRMGIRIRNVGPEQVMETVGYLAGMDGFEAAGAGKAVSADEGLPGAEVVSADGDLPAGDVRSANPVPEIPVEMMVLKQFSNRRLDELLLNLRKAGVPKSGLKAVLTEHNSGWTFYHLYEELKEEHETMTAGNKQ